MSRAWARSARSPAAGPSAARVRALQRSAKRLGLDLRRDLPQRRQGRSLRHARCDTEAMSLHLAEIATQIAPGAHAALLVDQAGWHLSGGLVVPPNITLIPLPPKCPELNAQENVWQFMRENWLSNRIFKSFNDIVDHCCDAWNKLIDQPWRIMSLGLRDWAYQSCKPDNRAAHLMFENKQPETRRAPRLANSRTADARSPRLLCAKSWRIKRSGNPTSGSGT